jgi:hypothetical protein
MKRAKQVFLGLMGLAFCKVGIEALANPQAVVDAVGISLNNASAFSSMRAVYGGMHLMFGLFCVYGIFRETRAALLLIALYTAGFTIGRLSGWAVEGAPNDFVTTWLFTEVVSGLLATTFLLFGKQAAGNVAVAH